MYLAQTSFFLLTNFGRLPGDEHTGEPRLLSDGYTGCLNFLLANTLESLNSKAVNTHQGADQEYK